MKRICYGVKRISLLFSLWAIVVATPVFVFGQARSSNNQTAQVKTKIEKIGLRGDLTIGLQNGKTYHGFVNKIDSSFYKKKLTKLESWNEWNEKIAKIADIGRGAFAGEINLHTHEKEIEEIWQAYEKLKREAIKLQIS